MIASDITPEHASALFAMIREFKGLHPTGSRQPGQLLPLASL